MGTINNTVDRAKSSLKENFGSFAKGNGNLITGFVAVAILVAGIGFVNGRETWWISGLTIIGCFLAVFLFLNARVFIKSFLAFVFAIIMANFAFESGLLFDSRTTISLVWLTAQIALFFGVISLSYIMHGSRSRWTGSMFATFFALVSATGFSEAMPPLWAIIASMVFGFIVFVLYYRVFNIVFEHRGKMPTNVISDLITENLSAAADKAAWLHTGKKGEPDETIDPNWNIREMRTRSFFRKKETVDFLVWNNDNAYVLHPVQLKEKFSLVSGKRSTKLTHNGYSINTWLLSLTYKRLPLLRTRNANMILVLLDVDNVNGKTAETIGVSIPDSVKKIPVGIYPAKNLVSGAKNAIKHGLKDIDKKYSGFVSSLTEKQKKAMYEIGLTGESEYLDNNDMDDTDETNVEMSPKNN